MSDTLDLHRLGPPALRAAWLFQALVAGPACLLFAIAALWTVYYPYSPPFIYPAIKELFFALFAAGILYILTVQRNYPQPHPRATATFELAKGLLATAAWLWLLLDAVFYRAPWYSFPVSPKQRTVFVSVSVVVLLLFFYPTIFWTARLAREARREAATHQDEEPSEESPLLEV